LVIDVEALVARDAHGRGVHAVGRQQLVPRLQVRRRKPDSTPSRVPPRHLAIEKIVMAEQRRRFVHASFRHEPPDARAGDDELLVPDRVDLLSLESVAHAERAKQREVPGSIAPEQEVRAHPHFDRVHPVDKRFLDERFGIPPRELVREPHHHHAVHARTLQRLQPLRRRHQERRSLVRTDNARRMWIECHRHRRPAALPGPPTHAVDDLHVPAVQPVEVTEGQHGLRPARARRIRKENYIHEFEDLRI
jgi:hypothetical protein